MCVRGYTLHFLLGRQIPADLSALLAGVAAGAALLVTGRMGLAGLAQVSQNRAQIPASARMSSVAALANPATSAMAALTDSMFITAR
jgi:hypothetical protein